MSDIDDNDLQLVSHAPWAARLQTLNVVGCVLTKDGALDTLPSLPRLNTLMIADADGMDLLGWAYDPGFKLELNIQSSEEDGRTHSTLSLIAVYGLGAFRRPTVAGA